MESKLTLRDLLAYLMVGVAFSFLSLLGNPSLLDTIVLTSKSWGWSTFNTFISRSDVPHILVLIIGLALMYLLGSAVQGFDNFVLRIGLWINNWKIFTKLRLNYPLVLFLHYREDFITKGKYRVSFESEGFKYANTIHQMSEGIVACTYLLIPFSIITRQWNLLFIYIVVYLIFSFKARLIMIDLTKMKKKPPRLP